MARSFHLISSTYGWTDDQILELTLRQIRQKLAVITEDKLAEKKEQRLIISWQTRSLAMVMAASSGTEELMKFAANLTIDNDELEEFNGETKTIKPVSKVPVNSNTQERETRKNFESAAEKNNIDLLSMFGQGLEKGKPGH